MVGQRVTHQSLNHQTLVSEGESDNWDRQEIWRVGWSCHDGTHGSQEGRNLGPNGSEEMGRPHFVEVLCEVRQLQQERPKLIQTANSNEAPSPIHLPSAPIEHNKPIRVSPRPSPLPQNLPHARINRELHGDDPASPNPLHERQQLAGSSGTWPFLAQVECHSAAGQLFQRSGVVRRKCLWLEGTESAGLAWVWVLAAVFCHALARCQRYYVWQDPRFQLLLDLQKRRQGEIPQIKSQPLQIKQGGGRRTLRIRRCPYPSLHGLSHSQRDQLQLVNDWVIII